MPEHGTCSLGQDPCPPHPSDQGRQDQTNTRAGRANPPSPSNAVSSVEASIPQRLSALREKVIYKLQGPLSRPPGDFSLDAAGILLQPIRVKIAQQNLIARDYKALHDQSGGALVTGAG